jgi:hypothetical protein
MLVILGSAYDTAFCRVSFLNVTEYSIPSPSGNMQYAWVSLSCCFEKLQFLPFTVGGFWSLGKNPVPIIVSVTFPAVGHFLVTCPSFTHPSTFTTLGFSFVLKVATRLRDPAVTQRTV